MFDPQDLVTFVLDALAGLLTLFQVVESILLLNIRVLRYLVTDALGVVSEGLLLLLIKSSLKLLISLLLGNDSEEFISGSSSLLSQSVFLVSELLDSRFFKLLHDFGAVGSFSSLTSSLVALGFFRGTLGSESIDISLSIGSSFLEFTKSLNLSLLFSSETLSFSDLVFFLFSSLTLVLQDPFLKTFLIGLLLLSEVEGLSIGCLYFNHHLGDSLLLLGLFIVLDLVLVLDVHQKLESLLFSHLLLTHANLFTLLDLIDDDASTAVLSFFAANLAVFLFLEVLQALDFHHEVELLLFSDPFFLEFLTFDELLVTDGDNFGVEDHLVHLLNVVLLFVHEGLGLGEKGLNTFHVFGLLLSRRKSRSTGSVVNLHIGFASMGAGARLL